MSAGEEKPRGLVQVQSTALAKGGANSLAVRGRNHLRDKEQAEEWLRKGLELQETAPEGARPELQTTLEYIKQILAGTQPVAAEDLCMTPADQERAHVAHFFMPDTLNECAQLEEARNNQLLEAFRCFEGGIQLDPHHPLLQLNIGTAYYFGRGIKQDYAQAYIWFRKAAEQGNASAQYCLGVLYSNGDGIDRDEVEAAAWLRKAAEQGNADAQGAMWLPRAGDEEDFGDRPGPLFPSRTAGILPRSSPDEFAPE
jgi:tetratricopeptide (TPR) repeat protein